MAIDGDFASVGFHDRTADEQAESGSFAPLFYAFITFENLGMFIFRNSSSMVLYGDEGASLSVLNGNEDGLSFAVFDRVGD